MCVVIVNAKNLEMNKSPKGDGPFKKKSLLTSQVVVADLLMSSDDCEERVRSPSLNERLKELDLKANSFKYQDTEQEV